MRSIKHCEYTDNYYFQVKPLNCELSNTQLLLRFEILGSFTRDLRNF